MQVRIGAGDGALSVAQAHVVMDSIKLCDPMAAPELTVYPEAVPGKKVPQTSHVPLLERALEEGQIQFAVVGLREIPLYNHSRIGVMALSARYDAANVLVLPPGQTRYDLSKPVACTGLRRHAQLTVLHRGWPVKMVEGDLPAQLSWLDGGHLGALVVPAWRLEMLGVRRQANKRYRVDEVTPGVGEGIIAVLALREQNCACLARFHNPVSWDLMTAENAFLKVFGGSPTAAAHAAPGKDKPEEIHIHGMWMDPEGLIWRRQLHGKQEHALTVGAALAQNIRLDREDMRNLQKTVAGKE